MTWEPVPPPSGGGTGSDVSDTEELHAGSRPRSRVTRWLSSALSVRLGRVAWTVVATVVVAAAVLGIVVHRSRERSAQLAEQHAASVATIRSWVESTGVVDAVNALSGGQLGDCASVDPQHPPQDRVLDELLVALSGYRPRSTARTIDQVGQLCMLQVAVQSTAGTIVVLRVQPPGDTVLPDRSADRSQAVVTGQEVGSTTSAGYASAVSPHHWTVTVGWSGPRSDTPDTDVLRSLAVAEAPRW